MMVNELTLCLLLVVAFPVWFATCHGSNCGNFSSETYAHQLCQIFWNVSNLPDYWLSSSDVCSWTANADEIHCQTGILTKLDLSSKNLQGSLSLEYQWPSELLFINIKNNSLLGTWNSSNYQNLPTTIVHLDISQNEFDGVIDLSSLAEHDQLLRLIMSKNSFSELSFNNSNGILTNLSSFVASNNIISNSIPNLSNLNDLSILDLSNNQINGNLLWEYIPSSIKQIELSNNEISSNLFENLTDIPQYVGFINFENNDLFGSINLDNLPESVDYLNLYNNSLTGPIDFSSISANISIKIDVSVYCDFEIYCTTVIDDCNLTFIDTMVDRSQSFCSGLIDCENTCQCDSCIFEPSVIPTEMPSQEPTFSGPVTTEMVDNNDNSTQTNNNNSSMTTTSDVTVEPPGGDGNGSENDASLIDSLLDPSTPTFYYFIGAIVAVVLCCICFIMIYYTKRSTKEFEKDKTLVSIKSQTKLNVDQATDSQKKDENSRSSMDKANQNGFIQVDSMSPTNPKGNGSYENVPNSPTSPQTQSQNSNTSSAMNQQQHIKRVDSDQDSNLEPHINRKVTVNYSHNSFADIDKENENDNDNDSDSSSSNAIAAATAAQIISQRNVFAGVQMAKIQSNPNSMTISAKGVMNNHNNNNNNVNENEESESSSSSSAKAQAAVEAHMAVERYRSIDMGIQHQQSQQENSLHSNRNSEHNGMNNNEFGMLGEEPGAIRPGSARVRSSTQVAQQQNKAANDVQLVGEIGGESDSGNDEMDQLPNLQQPPMRDNSMLNNYMNVEKNMNNNNNNNRMSVNSNNWDNRSIHSDINPLNNLQNPYMGHHSSIASLPPKPIGAQLHFNNSNHNHNINNNHNNNNNNNGGSNGMNKLRHRSNRSNSFDNVGDLLAVLQASEDDGGYNKKDDDVQSVQLPMQPSVYRNARHNTEVTDIVRYNEMKQKQQQVQQQQQRQQRQHEQNDIIMNYLKQNQNVNVDKLQASPISSSQQQAFANFGKNNNINNNNMNNNMNNNNNNNNMNNINPLDSFSLLQHGGGGGNGSGYNSHRNSQASQISTSQQHALLSLNNSVHNHNHNNQNRISKLSVASQSSYQGSGANVGSRHSSINLSVIDGDNENKMNVNGNDIKMDDDDDGDMEDLYSDDIPELGQLDMRQVKKNEQNDNEMDNNQHQTMGAPGTPNAPGNAPGNGETPVGNKPPMDFNQAGEGEYADYAD